MRANSSTFYLKSSITLLKHVFKSSNLCLLKHSGKYWLTHFAALCMVIRSAKWQPEEGFFVRGVNFTVPEKKFLDAASDTEPKELENAVR
jgi:hypothetical protein